MDTDRAIQIVRSKFPFEGYMDTAEPVYKDIAGTVQRYLRPGDRILDFGAGPADRTAVVQVLGFRCSAFDDLQDNWHQVGNNRDRILSFAREFSIDYRIRTDDGLPFEKGSFDMLMMHDVLEHLHDSPRSLLIALMDLVRPEGYLFVTVPNAVNIRKRLRVVLGKTNMPSFEQYYWYPDPWRGHVREYVRDDLVQLSEYLSLDVEELRGCHYMIQKKRLPGFLEQAYRGVTWAFPGLRDTWLLVAKKRPAWSPKRALTQAEFGEMMKTVTAYRY